jgi:hypothetical protein
MSSEISSVFSKKKVNLYIIVMKIMSIYSEKRAQWSKLLFPTLEVIYKTDSVCL